MTVSQRIDPMLQLDLFAALQSSTEGIDTEFKSACGGVANTQGGTIVLGVAEKPISLVWEGLPDAAQLRTVAGVGCQFGVAVW